MQKNRFRGALVGGLIATAMTAGAIGGAQAQDKSVSWDMAATYPSSLVQLGQAGVRATERIETVTGGTVKLKYHEPGALVPALEIFDAVANGAVDAGWGSPGFWSGKIPAANFFASVPFGPGAGEYMAWLYFGGGKELYEELYHEHGVHGVLCGVLAPEAGGWFRKEINSAEDLKGIKMRFFGLGAKVMDRLGANTQLMAPGDIYPALELGTIDATEFSMPAIDQMLKFHEVADYYYFPGWHQQTTFLEVLFSLDSWNDLSERQRTAIETACGDNIRYGLAKGEFVQIEALQNMQDKTEIKKFPDSLLETFEETWLEVAAEEAENDEDFARVWDSLQSFRENYELWSDLGYLQQ